MQTCPACQRRFNVPVPIERAPTPWERRGELGFVQAVWQTLKQTMLHPDTFWSSVRPEAPWVDAMLYGWMLTVVGAVLQVPFNMLTFSTMRRQMESAMAAGGPTPPEFERVMGWVSDNAAGLSGGFALATIVLYPLSFVLSGAVIHLGCLIFGANRNGFGATLRVVGYSSAPVLLAWVPAVGGAAGLYVLVLEIWGIYKVQETTVGRAIGGVLSLTVGLVCCSCGVLGAGAVTMLLQR
ncbi:Yip1 family protein [Hyalangium rubrum]|uniref:Yip1 family protein n=1 Tax=Hyalangium rubrum TaxID=3103134 RepID=A0ABU5H227_9BACT|nr:Yip1 family protein [Hyalangium sp. s54d21]MDY7227511.1 Yip1 family protein [Hyalangium sp. s54d21]